MADEAAQETAPTIVEATATETNGDSVQATDTEVVTETAPAAPETTETDVEDAPKERTYTQAEVKKFKDESQKLRQRLKDETESAAKEAAAAAKREAYEAFGKTLGLVEDDKPIDPEKLLEQAVEREAQAVEREAQTAAKLRAYELEKALTKAANSVDGDLDILTPYLKGTGAFDALDPDADDYADQVSAVVAAAVEANPKLKKATPVVAPTRSGGDISNGTGIPKKGPKTVADYVREDLEKLTRRNK